jgi:hypothetical protein
MKGEEKHLAYQPEVSNYGFKVNEELSTHTMKMNKKLMVFQALHSSLTRILVLV